MPPKLNNNFAVVYIEDEIPQGDFKVIAVPVLYLKDNGKKVIFLQFPHSEDDKQLLNSFLTAKIPPPPPESWLTFNCTVLNYFAGLKGAQKKMEKLNEDNSALCLAIAKAKTQSVETFKLKQKHDKEILASLAIEKEIDNCIKNLEPVQGLMNVSSNISLENHATNQSKQELNISSSESTVTVLEVQKQNELRLDETNTTYDLSSEFENSKFVNQSFENNDGVESTINDSGCDLKNEIQQSAGHGDILFINKSDFEDIMSAIKTLTSRVDALSNQITFIHQNQNTFNDKWDNVSEVILKVDSNVQDVAKELKHLSSKVNKEKFAAIDVSTKLSELHTLVVSQRALKQNEDVVSLDKFITLHQLSLPLTDIEQFKNFEGNLKENNSVVASNLQKHFISSISKTVDIEISMTTIFKSFFKKSVLKDTIAQKEISGKINFTSTKFYLILKESLINIFQGSFQEKLLLQAIGKVIKNSKDWEGGRKEREGKNYEKNASSNTNKIN